ncbi:MAG: ABC transporter ATP-binding protein [Bacteroidales bacterium]
MSLKIKNLSKSFQDHVIYSDFSIEIPEHTITCILGPSGCGKTTLLNLISKTTLPDSGEFIGFDNYVISYIFQEPRLLPWKTVRENIAFVLNKDNNSEDLVNKYIQLVELEQFADYFPSKLSGGMKQRVAIARAFAYPSDIILMDEPLKTLDFKLKQNLMNSFRQIWQYDKRTVLFVTHEVDEALMLGNDIYVFSKAPVEIIQKFSINSSERSLESTEMVELKKQILQIME